MKKNDLKKELKKAKKVNVWTLESESKKESNIKLKTKLKKAKKVNIWISESESKKDVFITRSEFSKIIPEILDKVSAYFTANKNNIIQARMDKDDKSFYEHLKIEGYSFINDQIDLLKNITQKQEQTVLKLILATYLILNKKELKISEVRKITGATRWMTDLLRRHFNLYGLKSVKNLKESLKNNFRQITIEELKSQTQKFPDSKLLLTVSTKIFDDALSKPNGLIADDLPEGRELKMEYLASSLIFYALNHSDFEEQGPKYNLYTVTEYINEFYPNDTTWKLAIQNIVPFLYDFLSDSLKVKISYFPIRGHDVGEDVKENVIKLRENKSSNKFIELLKIYIKKYSEKLPYSNNMDKLAIKILEDAISPPNKFSYIEIITKKVWFSTPGRFAPCFLYLAYNHFDSKPDSLNLLDFSEKYFKEYKDAIQTNVSFVFDYISQDLREAINYTPQYTQKIFLEYTKEVFIEKLREIKESNKELERIDNLILIDLILKTLDFSGYELKDFTKNLSFIHSRGTPSRIIERLTSPDFCSKLTHLDSFIKDYTNLLNTLNIKIQEKKLLKNLLEEFKEKRLKFYMYDENKREKLNRMKKDFSNMVRLFFHSKFELGISF